MHACSFQGVIGEFDDAEFLLFAFLKLSTPWISYCQLSVNISRRQIIVANHLVEFSQFLISLFLNLHEFCIHQLTSFTKLHRAAEAHVFFPITALQILDVLCFLRHTSFSSCDGDAEVRANDFAAHASSVKLGLACASGAGAGPVDCYTFSGA